MPKNFLHQGSCIAIVFWVYRFSATSGKLASNGINILIIHPQANDPIGKMTGLKCVFGKVISQSGFPNSTTASQSDNTANLFPLTVNKLCFELL